MSDDRRGILMVACIIVASVCLTVALLIFVGWVVWLMTEAAPGVKATTFAVTATAFLASVVGLWRLSK